MFYADYCQISGGEITRGIGSYQDEIMKEYDEKRKQLDNFIYLIDMFNIMESCCLDLLDVSFEGEIEFWKINKLLMNYVNSVYTYKEMVRYYEPSLDKVSEEQYKNRQYYRFICDFRNRIIHQGTIITDATKDAKDIMIDLDEALKIQEQLKKKDKLYWTLKDFYNDAVIFQGKHFYSMKVIAAKAKIEINEMKADILDFAFELSIRPVLTWLIALVEKVNESYAYTFIREEKNPPSIYFEPNYVIEDFTLQMLHMLGADSVIVNKILNFMKDNKYYYFYDCDCQLDEIVNKAIHCEK